MTRRDVSPEIGESWTTWTNKWYWNLLDTTQPRFNFFLPRSTIDLMGTHLGHKLHTTSCSVTPYASNVLFSDELTGRTPLRLPWTKLRSPREAFEPTVGLRAY